MGLSTPTLSNSLSSSSLNHHNHHSNQFNNNNNNNNPNSLLISSSISAEKLSTIHLNPPPNTTNPLLDSEEIGHGIPTPECLPQSRKHSIAQSKLVTTPRLSTS